MQRLMGNGLNDVMMIGLIQGCTTTFADALRGIQKKDFIFCGVHKV